MLGVFASLAMKMSGRFESDYLHQVKLWLGDRVERHTDGETAVESVLRRAAPRCSNCAEERNGLLVRLIT